MPSFLPPRSDASNRKSAGPARSVSAVRQAPSAPRVPAAARRPEGLPEPLQTVMEAMSGFSLADVVVHRNSAEPARLGAAAFAQGNQIHLAPGQERHLPHEAWHVVQQAQGRVKPTLQMKSGVPLNEDASLEREADLMAIRSTGWDGAAEGTRAMLRAAPAGSGFPVQLISKEITINSSQHRQDLGTAGEEVSGRAGDLTRSLNEDFTAYLTAPETLTSAHILAKQFGGPGGIDNVRPWAESFEATWTAKEQEARRWVDEELQQNEVLIYKVTAVDGSLPTWIKNQHDAVVGQASERAKEKWRPLLANAVHIPSSATLAFERKRDQTVVASDASAWDAASILPTKAFKADSYLMETQAQAAEAEQEGLGLSLFD